MDFSAGDHYSPHASNRDLGQVFCCGVYRCCDNVSSNHFNRNHDLSLNLTKWFLYLNQSL